MNPRLIDDVVDFLQGIDEDAYLRQPVNPGACVDTGDDSLDAVVLNDRFIFHFVLLGKVRFRPFYRSIAKKQPWRYNSCMNEDPAKELNRVMKREGVEPGDLGYNRASLWKILTGRVSPTWTTTRKLFRLLGYDVFVHAKKRE